MPAAHGGATRVRFCTELEAELRRRFDLVMNLHVDVTSVDIGGSVVASGCEWW